MPHATAPSWDKIEAGDERLGTDNRPTTSELHMWLGDKHHFLGVVNDQTSEIECIEADENALETIRDSMVAADPSKPAPFFVVETEGPETRLLRFATIGEPGDLLLSFFRD